MSEYFFPYPYNRTNAGIIYSQVYDRGCFKMCRIWKLKNCEVLQKYLKNAKSLYTIEAKYGIIKKYSNISVWVSAFRNYMLINVHNIIYFLLLVNNKHIDYCKIIINRI